MTKAARLKVWGVLALVLWLLVGSGVWWVMRDGNSDSVVFDLTGRERCYQLEGIDAYDITLYVTIPDIDGAERTGRVELFVSGFDYHIRTYDTQRWRSDTLVTEILYRDGVAYTREANTEWEQSDDTPYLILDPYYARLSCPSNEYLKFMGDLLLGIVPPGHYTTSSALVEGGMSFAIHRNEWRLTRRLSNGNTERDVWDGERGAFRRR